MKFIPVILAGGSGDRFWPLSRHAKPKQFLTLENTGRSLLQATADRLEALCEPDDIHVVCGQTHRALVLDQLPNMPLEHLLVEPCAKDTAAAVLFAVLRVAQTHGSDAIVGIFPSDHRIGNNAAFQEKVQSAIQAAYDQDVIVTLGIQPSHAATGYGYIQAGTQLEQYKDVWKAQRFVEKPNLSTAQAYLEDGGYFWNAGMFVFRASVMLEAFAEHAPDILESMALITTRQGLNTAYEWVRKTSVDYAILEPAQNVLLIPSEFDWDDLGDWNALARLHSDQSDNVAIGQHLNVDSTRTMVYNSNQTGLLVTLGLEDVLIVRDGDVTLVARKDRSQDIKNLVAQIKADPQWRQYT
jgi:mannose-1-phosphate guanylyltransferase